VRAYISGLAADDLSAARLRLPHEEGLRLKRHPITAIAAATIAATIGEPLNHASEKPEARSKGKRQQTAIAPPKISIILLLGPALSSRASVAGKSVFCALIMFSLSFISLPLKTFKSDRTLAAGLAAV
jgi:hypothetical protein